MDPPLPPSSLPFVLRVCVTRCGTPTNLIKRHGCKRVCVSVFLRARARAHAWVGVSVLCLHNSTQVSKNTFLASTATWESKEVFAHVNCWCVLHVPTLIPCTGVGGGYQNALLAGSMCQWLILPASQGRADSSPSSASPPHPIILSPPHRHLHRWVPLLFPHRILIIAIEGFSRGWSQSFLRSHGWMV